MRAEFARRRASARRDSPDEIAPEAKESVIEELISVGFWASLRREEGRSPKISLAFVPPDLTGDAVYFERPIPLDADGLTRLAPAVERPGIHLGVWGEPGRLSVWGSARVLPRVCFVLEVVEPGLIVVKYSREGALTKFGNVAVIEGDRIKMIDESVINNPDCPRLLIALNGINPTGANLDATRVMLELSLSMRAHGHGGTLLVVPAESSRWEKSIVEPITYRVSPPFLGLSELLSHDQSVIDGAEWRHAFRQMISALGGLTAVDGAAIIDDQYDLLAFGAKIERMEGSTTVRQILLVEPVNGAVPVRVDAAEIGGTRHLSAAQFVHDQRDAVALVASQDGRFTIFAWSETEERVQAHRIESLLL